jgi:hypothetical protein
VVRTKLVSNGCTLFVLFALALLGCGDSGGKHPDGGVTVDGLLVGLCTSDEQCDGGWFCDRGTCTQVSADLILSPYGALCSEPVILPGTDMTAPSVIDKCRGLYICIEGRCRSCIDTMECLVPRICQTGTEKYRGSYCGMDPG